MSDISDREVIEVVTDEPSRVHRIAVPAPTAPTSGERLWVWARLVLVTLVAAVALGGGLGRAFYITRSEYADRTQTEAVARENMRGTLERLDKTLGAQAAAFDRLTDEVQTIKLDLARKKR